MEYFTHVFSLAYGILFCSASIEDVLTELESMVKVQHEVNEGLSRRIEGLENQLLDLIAAGIRPKPNVENRINSGVEQSDYNNITEEAKYGLSTFKELIFKRAPVNNIAFYAYRSLNRCYSDNETIIFDAESLDEGGLSDVGVYHPKNGIFEPPATGIYVITWTVAAPTGGDSFVTELLVSGSVSGVITSDPDGRASTTGNPDPQAQRRAPVSTGVHPATAAVVMKVDAGAHCFIRVRQTTGGCVTVLSDSNTVLSAFSAWRLF